MRLILPDGNNFLQNIHKNMECPSAIFGIKMDFGESLNELTACVSMLMVAQCHPLKLHSSAGCSRCLEM